ncbi:hypothetical protein BDF19DRAFT_425229 [Syncephalis fuscata]|nr:hypothetical protein BDF19DRAFT_425229 [Syncephalis fuscata]
MPNHHGSNEDWNVPVFAVLLGVFIVSFGILTTGYLLRLLQGQLEEIFRPKNILLTAYLGCLWIVAILVVWLLNGRLSMWIVHMGMSLLAGIWLSAYAWWLCTLGALLKGWLTLVNQHTLWPWENSQAMELKRYIHNASMISCHRFKYLGGLGCFIGCLLVCILGMLPLWINPSKAIHLFIDTKSTTLTIYLLDVGIGLYSLCCTLLALWIHQHLQQTSSNLLGTELVITLSVWWICFGLQLGLRSYLGIYYIGWPIIAISCYELLSIGRSLLAAPPNIELTRPVGNTTGWKHVVADSDQWRLFTQYALDRGFNTHIEFVELYHTLINATYQLFTERDQYRVFTASVRWGLLCHDPLAEAMPSTTTMHHSNITEQQQPSTHTPSSSISSQQVSNTTVPSLPLSIPMMSSTQSAPMRIPITATATTTNHVPSSSVSLGQSLQEIAADANTPDPNTRLVTAQLIPAYHHFYQRFIQSLDYAQSLNLTQHAIEEVTRRIEEQDITVDLFRECYAEIEWQLYQGVFIRYYARSPPQYRHRPSISLVEGRLPGQDPWSSVSTSSLPPPASTTNQLTTTTTASTSSMNNYHSFPVRFPGRPPLADDIFSGVRQCPTPSEFIL